MRKYYKNCVWRATSRWGWFFLEVCFWLFLVTKTFVMKKRRWTFNWWISDSFHLYPFIFHSLLFYFAKLLRCLLIQNYFQFSTISWNWLISNLYAKLAGSFFQVFPVHAVLLCIMGKFHGFFHKYKNNFWKYLKIK